MFGGEKMDYTDRFSGKGEIYAKARPKYAQGLFVCYSAGQQDCIIRFIL